MKVKRITSILLVLIMVFSLVNCQAPIKNTTTKEISNFVKKDTGYLFPVVEDHESSEPIEEACLEGHEGACELLAKLLDEAKAPESSPTPSPSPSQDCSSETSISPSQLAPDLGNTPKFATQSFRTKNFRIKDFSSEDIIENVNFLVDRVENVKTIEYKIANFTARGETAKVAELNLELQDAIVERDSVKADVLNGLNDYKVGLRNHVNTLMNDPTFSVDYTEKPINLLFYKYAIEDYSDYFKIAYNTKNTSILIYTYSFLADQIQLLSDLIKDYSSNLIQNIEVQNNIPISKLDKVKDAIKYLSEEISHNKNKLDVKVKEIGDEYDDIVKQILYNNSIKSSIYFTGLMIGAGILDPITLEINTSLLNNFTVNSFNIKNDPNIGFDGQKFLDYIGTPEHQKELKKTVKETWNDAKNAIKNGTNRLINVADTVLGIQDKLTKPAVEYTVRNSPGGDKLTPEQISKAADNILTGVGIATMFNPKNLGKVVLHPLDTIKDAKNLALTAKEIVQASYDSAAERIAFLMNKGVQITFEERELLKKADREKKQAAKQLKDMGKAEEDFATNAKKSFDDVLDDCKKGKINQTFKNLDDVLENPKLGDYRKKHGIPENIDLGEITIEATSVKNKDLEKMLKEHSKGEWVKEGYKINNPVGIGKEELHLFRNKNTGEIFNPKGEKAGYGR
ncbi:MAG: hypothetical protein AABZ74_00810 [Cyanobacteriota bacterium]